MPMLAVSPGNHFSCTFFSFHSGSGMIMRPPSPGSFDAGALVEVKAPGLCRHAIRSQEFSDLVEIDVAALGDRLAKKNLSVMAIAVFARERAVAEILV